MRSGTRHGKPRVGLDKMYLLAAGNGLAQRGLVSAFTAVVATGTATAGAAAPWRGDEGLVPGKVEPLPRRVPGPAPRIEEADGEPGHGAFPGARDPDGSLHLAVGAAGSGACRGLGPAKGLRSPGSCLGLFLVSQRDNSGPALLTLSLGSEGGLSPVLVLQVLGSGGFLGPLLEFQSPQPDGLQSPGSPISLDPLLVLQSHHPERCLDRGLVSHPPGFEGCLGPAPVSHPFGFDDCLDPVTQCPGPDCSHPAQGPAGCRRPSQLRVAPVSAPHLPSPALSALLPAAGAAGVACNKPWPRGKPP